MSLAPSALPERPLPRAGAALPGAAELIRVRDLGRAVSYGRGLEEQPERAWGTRRLLAALHVPWYRPGEGWAYNLRLLFLTRENDHGAVLELLRRPPALTDPYERGNRLRILGKYFLLRGRWDRVTGYLRAALREYARDGALDARLKEATKLGFDCAIVPAGVGSRADVLGLRLCRLRRVSELLEVLGASADPTGFEMARGGVSG